MNDLGGKHRYGVPDWLALALGLATVRGPCRQTPPTLFLQFEGLPPQARDLTVDLTSTAPGFEGLATSAGPASVSYPGEGACGRRSTGRRWTASVTGCG